MAPDANRDDQLHIGHVLFTDIVGYSKLLSDEQREVFRLFNEIVRNTRQFRLAEEAGKLVRLATGDGIALAFFTSPDAPVRCAREISGKLREHPQLQLRMGINSGPVDEVSDVNDRRNVTGAGINMAQRVMDCGDAGHVLLSKRVADDLAQYSEWQPHLHELGDVEVKHGARVQVVNLYNQDFGNPDIPSKIKHAEQERAIASARAAKLKHRRVVIATSAALLLLVSAVLGTWLWQGRTAGTAGLIEKSIAVLPFESFSDDKENAYLADGVQDDILTDLSKVADLKVIGRRSVAQYRDTKKSIREIGQALGVTHVLEGSVGKAAGRIHVTAQLIDARTEAQTWAEKYDRAIADIFAIQSEISQTIVRRLRAALSPAEKASIEKTPTRDMAAYDLYLRGKQLFYDLPYTEDQKGGLFKTIDLLSQATARDGSFALAYCLQAIAQTNLFSEFDHDPAHLEEARSSAETALTLAPDLGEAHFAQGYYLYHGVRDTDRALSEFVIAARALPNDAEVLAWTGRLQRRLGRWNDALHNLQKATDLDPHNADPPIDLIVTYELLRNYSAAERVIDRAVTKIPQITNRFRAKKALIALEKADRKACQATLELIPPDYDQGGFIPYLWSRLAFYNHDYARAATVLAGIPKEGQSDFTKAWLARDQALIARAQGDSARAQSALLAARTLWEAELRKKPNDPVALSWLAVWDAGLGRKEDAMRESQKAVDLQSLAPDAANETDVAERQAVVCAWSGEHDVALQQLAMLAKIPSNLSPGDLKFNPGWDNLRRDPRFDRVIAQTSVPVKID